MKNTTGNKIRLGVFVSVGIALFIAAIYFIGQRQQMFNTTFRLSSIFKDISGLQVGNNVRFSGINIGIIDNIEQITDSTVKVEMEIDEKSRKFIKRGAKAIVGSDGLMGNKIVVISPGIPSEKMVVNNDVLTSVKPVSMDDILVKIKVTSDNAASITDDIVAITGNIRSGKGTIGKLFFDDKFAKSIDQTVVNIKQGAGSLKENMDAAGHSIFLRGFLKKKNKKNKEEKENKENKK